MVLIAKGDGNFWVGRHPVREWTLTTPEEYLVSWEEARTMARENNLMMAVALGYESAFIWNPEIPHPPSLPSVLAWWGLYTDFQIIHPNDLAHEARVDIYTLPPIPRWSLDQYQVQFEKVKEILARGDSYQLNLTFFQDLPLACPFGTLDREHCLGLFLKLVAAGQGSQGSYFEIGDQVLISLSPELFFSKTSHEVVCLPMKGTSPRSADPHEDQQLKFWLQTSEKNLAENLMITDMIRNDLGRIADPGSVVTSDLFKVETYPTVFQMVSRVTAQTPMNATEILKALFPCASITGAPKIRSIEKLAQLESGPRGWYTGAFGWIDPEEDARFTVGIRTIEVDLVSGNAQIGTGGGVVWDSTGESEYQECLLKARFLKGAQRDFDLTEALLWTPDSGFFLLQRHLERMEKAARDFGGPFQTNLAENLLYQSVGPCTSSQKVRLSLKPDFSLTVFCEELHELPAVLTAALSPEPLGPESLIYRRYKTSQRQVYSPKVPGADQVIFYNEKGELTESTSMNLVIELNNEKLTPALSSGLLNGTFREELLSIGEIKESILKVEDLYKAQKIWLINSVRLWREVSLLDQR